MRRKLEAREIWFYSRIQRILSEEACKQRGRLKENVKKKRKKKPERNTQNQKPIAETLIHTVERRHGKLNTNRVY